MTAPASASKDPQRVAASLALGAIGGALIAQRRERRLGPLAAAIGVGLIVYAARPLLRDWVLRRGGARRRIRLRTTIEIARPVNEVFAFCKDFENFARVIGSLRRVTDYQDGRSHWEAYSPTGEIVEWDAVVTKYVPNAVIGWTSVASSRVIMSGVIRFAATPNNSTRLTLDLTYVPQDNRLAEALKAMAVRPRTKQLLAELRRASFYVESLPPTPPTPPRDSAA